MVLNRVKFAFFFFLFLFVVLIVCILSFDPCCMCGGFFIIRKEVRKLCGSVSYKELRVCLDKVI